MQQIDHEGGDSGAVLHGRVDAFWKRSPRLRAAGGASATVRAMFGDDERLRLGQIEHLTRGAEGLAFHEAKGPLVRASMKGGGKRAAACLAAPDTTCQRAKRTRCASSSIQPFPSPTIRPNVTGA